MDGGGLPTGRLEEVVMPDGSGWKETEEEVFVKLKDAGILHTFVAGAIQSVFAPDKPVFAFECFDPRKRQHWKKKYRESMNLETMQEVPISGPGIALALAKNSPIPRAAFEWDHVCKRIDETQEIFGMEIKAGILVGHMVCKAAEHYGICLSRAIDLQLESKRRLQDEFGMKIVMAFHSSYPDRESRHACFTKNRGLEKTYHLSGDALRKYRQATQRK